MLDWFANQLDAVRFGISHRVQFNYVRDEKCLTDELTLHKIAQVI